MSEFPAARLTAYQWRISLHERYFKPDQYAQPKLACLRQQLLTHTRLYAKLNELVGQSNLLDLPSTRNSVESTCTDGVILGISMLSRCNQQVAMVLSNARRQGKLTEEQAVRRLSGALGALTQLFDELDDGGAENPLLVITRQVGVMLDAYCQLRVRDSETLDKLFVDIKSRLLLTEGRHIFGQCFQHEIKTLYPMLEF